MGPGPSARQDEKNNNTIKKLKTMKKILTSAIAILAMVGCTSEDFVGDKELQRQNEDGAPISFNLVSAPPTRALQTGSTAATALNNNFVVYGQKTKGGTTPETQVVFYNYQANYVDGSAATTTSNSAGWEYVGYKNLPYGTTTTSGGTLNTDGVAANATAGVDQSIKYWDYSASKYEFFGYSLGKGDGATTPTYAKATAMTPYTYTLSGNQAQLAECYISDLLTKKDMSATNTQVQLQFRKMESKVRIALYENIPGYSVKDVKFYQSASATTPGTTAYLYDNGTTPSLPKQGQFVVSYTAPSPDPTNTTQTPATVTWTAASSDGTMAEVSFGNSAPTNTGADKWTGWAGKEYQEADETVYLGRASNEATISESQSVLPNPTGTVLTLKVDYTLVSRDGYGETIEVKGATATVPAAYAQWQPNCSYTYLFKITDEDLDPITLDAAVITNADGKQETITTVSEPSITTYSSNSNVNTNNEYAAGENVYAVVEDGGSLATLSDANMKLYTVTTTDATNFPITEGSVADALLKQTTLTAAEATAAKIKCTTSSLTYGKTAGDTGKEIEMDATNNVVASFTVAVSTVYVLQYIKTEATYTYDAGQTYADATAFAAAGTLYTKSGDVYTEATSWTDGTTYYKRKSVSNEGVYAYKVINVASGS